MSKQPGDWYGVNSIAQVLVSIFTSFSRQLPQGSIIQQVKDSMSVLTFQEGGIYLDVIIERIKQGLREQRLNRELEEERKKNAEGGVNVGAIKRKDSYVMVEEFAIKEV